MLWLFIGVINDNNEVEDTGRKKLAILSPVLIGQLFLSQNWPVGYTVGRLFVFTLPKVLVSVSCLFVCIVLSI